MHRNLEDSIVLVVQASHLTVYPDKWATVDVERLRCLGHIPRHDIIMPVLNGIMTWSCAKRTADPARRPREQGS